MRESMMMNKETSAEDWVDADEELPEEGTTVLVYLDCDAVTLGVCFDDEWETTESPWDSAISEDADVLFWRHLPWPSAEMLTPSGTDSVSVTTAHSSCKLVVVRSDPAATAAETNVREHFSKDGMGTEKVAGSSEGGEIVV